MRLISHAITARIDGTSFTYVMNRMSETMVNQEIKEPDEYEKLARKFIEGTGGLFDLYAYELASPLCEPPEVEGARWILLCLTNPKNRDVLENLVRQSKMRGEDNDNR